MFKKIFVTLLCAATILTGCGQTQISQNGNSEPGSSTDQTVTSPEAPVSNTDLSESSDADTDVPSGEETPSVSDSRTPETVSLVMNQMNGNEKVSITMIGLCQYDSLESDAYTDVPADGNVYLAMFFDIVNHDNGDDYINPENMSATVDDEAVSHLGVFNQPESYEPVFDHIGTGEKLSGYVVWEVPSDWQSFDMEYTGWQDTCSLTVTAHVTPDLLTTPPSIE